MTAGEDHDPYVTKIGGRPVWLVPDTKAPYSALLCKACASTLYLLFQAYVPLEHSPYHRCIYVWGCNRRQCMRKEGSFRVWRSHLMDQEYLLQQKRKTEARKAKEESKKHPVAMVNPFGDGFGGGFVSNPFAIASTTSTTSAMSALQPQPAQTSYAVIATPSPSSETTLNAAMEQLKVDDRPDWPPHVDLPAFPGQYIDTTEEVLDDGRESFNMQRYKQYLDLEKVYAEADAKDSGGESWAGEVYEKQHLPKGVDKAFKQFTERVSAWPSQCIRYQYRGQPLLYSNSDTTAATLRNRQISRCPHCKAPRTFELQLMPNMLSVLPIADYTPDTAHKEAAGADRWNVGMDWGTILIYACSKDCHGSASPPQDNVDDQVRYYEEVALVQYEVE